MNKLTDELNRTYSKTKALLKEIETLSNRNKDYKMRINGMKAEIRSLKSSKEITNSISNKELDE